MAKAIDITGKIYGRWTAIKFMHKVGRFHYWLFRCSCGTEKVFYKGHTVGSNSCGCLNKEQKTTHGKSKTKIYGVWKSMRSRCKNPNVKSYPDYGGRGVKVCERWESFDNFYEDMGDPPFIKAEINRINNNGDYEPGNCEWITKIKNLTNTRQNVVIVAFGKSMTESEWARETGLDRTVISYRIKHGWPAEKALTTPARPIKRGKGNDNKDHGQYPAREFPQSFAKV
jgi:hypothetical protein